MTLWPAPFFLILLSRIVNIIHESLCTDPGVRLHWHTGRGNFHNEILFCFFVLASFANIGVKRCGCMDKAEVDSERERRRRRYLLRLESGLRRPIMKAVSVWNPWSTTSKRLPCSNNKIGHHGMSLFAGFFSYPSVSLTSRMTATVLPGFYR